ncbi:hypothetical protein Bca4012_065174 [Brassica carinata]|uniref:Argonaute linker 1 domain-containing protein n=1 Tax=Brassica carinata TaxID=52824 RepID=A0A8X8AXJ4_BRACI|nr:hypothetical protein Bca52824_017604 [Brassica carinata]
MKTTVSSMALDESDHIRWLSRSLHGPICITWVEFLAGKRADGPLQVLDIVLRELSVKRFYPSVRPTQMGLSLNIDMASAAFIEPLPVIDFLSTASWERCLVIAII